MKAVFIETSTKENQNVMDIFVLAVAQMEGHHPLLKQTIAQLCEFLKKDPNLNYTSTILSMKNMNNDTKKE